MFFVWRQRSFCQYSRTSRSARNRSVKNEITALPPFLSLG